jgi:hypothetical protein
MQPKKHDNTVPIAAGGVLALLAVGSAAVAINRRRDEENEEWAANDGFSTAADDRHSVELASDDALIDEQRNIVAPPASAFQWGQDPAKSTQEDRTDDRQPGETWVERAYRGPSPLNPSVSLKTRLKRAAFFDKRERDAAAGIAEPVDPAAGLPERLVDEGESKDVA